MIFETSSPVGKMFWGNILLLGCCVFYLLWWVLAFRPIDAIKGMRSGWLLIPAFILGIIAVVMIIRGANETNIESSFFTMETVLFVSILSYIVLFLVTWFVFHRQVTTELFLIVAWVALVFLENNALYGLEFITWNEGMALFMAAIIVAVLSMLCYLLYYDLDIRLGYVDGMLPLILVAIYMTVLTAFIARAGS